MEKEITFNDWKIKVDTKGNCDILNNNDKLIVIDDSNEVSLIMRTYNSCIQVTHLDYVSQLYINNEKKELVLKIPYL